MGLLVDSNLRAAASAKPATIITGIDEKKIDESIRGCAINLRIGDIFMPGAEPEKLGSANRPRESYPLAEGHTALIRTAESFLLDDEHAAIVFPASAVSMQGLLMTNPGLVDPGYCGPLHVTVINMGREVYSLKRGDRLLRGIVFKLENSVAAPYATPNKSPVTEELLQKLSPDFLSVSSRAASAAKREIDAATNKGLFLQFALPVVATALAAVITYFATNSNLRNDFEQRIKSLEVTKASERLQKLETSVTFEKRLDAIDNKIQQFESKRKK